MVEQSLVDMGFRPMLEALPEASVVTDSLGRVVALNREVERLLGWSEDGLLGQPMNRLVPLRFHRTLDSQPVFNPGSQEGHPKGTRSASSPGGGAATRRDMRWRSRHPWLTPKAR